LGQRLLYRLGLGVVQGEPAESNAVKSLGHANGQQRQAGFAANGRQAASGPAGEFALGLTGGADQAARGQKPFQAAVKFHFYSGTVPVFRATAG
jgi:hypothetical protein